MRNSTSNTSIRWPSSSPAGGSRTRWAGPSTRSSARFHEETCEPLENPLAVAIRRTRAIKSRAADAADPPRRQRAVRREHAPRRSATARAQCSAACSCSTTSARAASSTASSRITRATTSSPGSSTGASSRARLERALKSAKARESSYALCYLDIDQFKIINDTCGHSAGDALLGQVGALLKSKIRWRDTLARLGGDEFGVLLESCSLDEALRTAEALREAIRNFKFVWEERTFRLGASIGVVPITAENEDVASLLSAADSACAAAKEGGRNRVYSFAGKRHRPDAPPARDAMGGAHQQRARGRRASSCSA